MEKVKEEVVLADYPWFYGGFWVRFGAWFIDCIILSIVISIVPDIWFIPIVYFIGFWIWRGQTPGKMAFRVRIVTTDGKRIRFGTAVLRLLMYLVSGFILCLGFLQIAFDQRKQGWHDKVAKTYVVTKSGETQAEAMYAEYMEKMNLWESVGLDVTDIKKLLD